MWARPLHGFVSQRKKKYLQAFYTFEIKLSLIVLIFFDTNINTDVDALAKKLITFPTTLLLNKCWQISITQHQCKDLTVCIPIEHKVYKIDALLHDQQAVCATQAIILPWSIPIILLFTTTQNDNKYRYYLLSKHVHKVCASCTISADEKYSQQGSCCISLDMASSQVGKIFSLEMSDLK